MSKTAEALVVFNQALYDELLPLSGSAGGVEGELILNWSSWVGMAVSAIHTIQCKVEAGQSIIIPCERCGDMLSMFEVARDETICSDCKEDDDALQDAEQEVDKVLRLGFRNPDITPSA